MQEPLRPPRLRRDLTERARSVGRITSLNMSRSKLIVQEEKSRQARSNEHEPLPPQPEVVREWQREDTNKETNQIQGLGSIPNTDTQPRTMTLPSRSPSFETYSDDPKLPEKPKNTAYYCDVCLINTTRFSLDVRSFVTNQLSFTNSSKL